MNKKVVLLDFDGVVVDLLGSCKNILAEKNISFDETKITSYKFDGNIGCDKNKIYALFNEVDTFKRALPYNGAITALDKLKTFVDVVPYTSVANNEAVFNCRRDLIQELGIDKYIRQPFVGKTKPQMLGYDAVFEDDPSVVDTFKGTDTQIYLIDHTYNHCVDDNLVTRCKDFSEAVDIYLSRLKIEDIA